MSVTKVAGTIVVGAAKAIAAQKLNKKLVETIKSQVRKTNMVPSEIMDHPYFDTVMEIVTPALLLWLASSQEEFLSDNIGSDNAARVQELAQLALTGASTELVKPILMMAIPTIKQLLSSVSSSGKELAEPKYSVTQE